MANTEQINEQSSTKVQLATRVEQNIADAIETIRTEEDRNTSSTIERLLKTHPRIQPMLEADAAGVGA